MMNSVLENFTILQVRCITCNSCGLHYKIYVTVPHVGNFSRGPILAGRLGSLNFVDIAHVQYPDPLLAPTLSLLVCVGCDEPRDSRDSSLSGVRL